MTNPGQTTNADQGANPGMMPADPQRDMANAGRIEDTDQRGYAEQGSSMGTDAASGQPGGMNARTGQPAGSEVASDQLRDASVTGGYGGQQEYPDQSDVSAPESTTPGGVSQTGGMSQSGMDAETLDRTNSGSSSTSSTAMPAQGVLSQGNTGMDDMDQSGMMEQAGAQMPGQTSQAKQEDQAGAYDNPDI